MWFEEKVNWVGDGAHRSRQVVTGATNHTDLQTKP